MFLQRQAREGQADVAASNAITGLGEGIDGFTAAHRWRRDGRDPDGPVESEVANVVDALLAGQAGHAGHRHQLTAAVAHHQSGEIFRPTSFAAFDLQNDRADATVVVGVIDVAAAEGGADLPQGCAVVEIESSQLVAVELQSPAGEAGIKAGAHPFKPVRRLGRLDEILGDLAELLQAELPSAAVQQFQRKS